MFANRLDQVHVFASMKKKKKEEEIVFDMSEMIGALEQPGVAEVVSYPALWKEIRLREFAVVWTSS